MRRDLADLSSSLCRGLEDSRYAPWWALSSDFNPTGWALQILIRSNQQKFKGTAGFRSSMDPQAVTRTQDSFNGWQGITQVSFEQSFLSHISISCYVSVCHDASGMLCRKPSSRDMSLGPSSLMYSSHLLHRHSTTCFQAQEVVVHRSRLIYLCTTEVDCMGCCRVRCP